MTRLTAKELRNRGYRCVTKKLTVKSLKDLGYRVHLILSCGCHDAAVEGWEVSIHEGYGGYLVLEKGFEDKANAWDFARQYEKQMGEDRCQWQGDETDIQPTYRGD